MGRVYTTSQGPVSLQDNWLVALWSGIGGEDTRNESQGVGLLEVPGDQAGAWLSPQVLEGDSGPGSPTSPPGIASRGHICHRGTSIWF